MSAAWKLFGQLGVSLCNLLGAVIGGGGGNDDELHDSRQDDKPDSGSDGRGAKSKTNGVPHLNEIP